MKKLAFRYLLGVFCLAVIFQEIGTADVRGLTGEVFFDVNSDRANEAVLSSNGLGIGCSPSCNLHVQGSAVVNTSLSIGNAAFSSNLNIGGTLGQSCQIVTGNTTLDAHSLVFINSSSGNML